MRHFIVILMCFIAFQSFAEKTKVYISDFKPFVMKEGGGYTGFDIELFEHIATKLNIDYEYHEVNFKNLISEVESGNGDIGLAGITITNKRELTCDFSHPYIDSSLRMMVNGDKISFFSIIQTCFWQLLHIIFWLIIFLIFCGHVFWLTEKGKDMISDEYIQGVGEGMWLTLCTMTTVGYGDYAPKKILGRLAASLIMISGIIFCSFIFAEINTTIAHAKESSIITSIEEVKHKKIAVVEGTTSYDYLNSININVELIDSLDEAVVGLLSDNIDVIVFDEPALKYMMAKGKKGQLMMIGEKLKEEYYGFLFPQNSEMREPFNRALLEMRENGEYNEIYSRWFK